MVGLYSIANIYHSEDEDKRYLLKICSDKMCA